MPKLPLYAKIKQELREAIESGELPEGARVPSEMELAAQYGVSRNPTRQALRELELAGYITRTRRRGSFVAPRTERAPHLRLYQGKVLAIVCPHVRSPHVRGIVEGFIQSAAERNYNAMVYFMECSDKAQAEVLSDIHHSGLGGVALWVAEDIQETLAVLRQFQERNYPFVLYDRFLPELASDYVVTDNMHMAYAITRELVRAGHRTIGFFNSAYVNSANDDRVRGYRRALEEAGLETQDTLMSALTPERSSAAYAIHRVVAHKSRPTAFFCAEGWICELAAKELRRLGYRVPGDIELACVDDGELQPGDDVCRLTARQRSYQLGHQAAEVLVQRVENRKSPPEQRRLKPVLSFETSS